MLILRAAFESKLSRSNTDFLISEDIGHQSNRFVRLSSSPYETGIRKQLPAELFDFPDSLMNSGPF